MKKPALRCALFMALYYGANAVYQGYISKFYQQSGISGSRLILLLVSFPLLSILSQPLWGWASDRMLRRNVALLITVGASIPLLCLLGLMKGYAGMAIVSCLFALFYPCVQPLGDSLILQSLQESHIPYGRVRLAGSVSYALCSLAAGALLRRNYRAMPWMAAGMLALLFGALPAVSLLVLAIRTAIRLLKGLRRGLVRRVEDDVEKKREKRWEKARETRED